MLVQSYGTNQVAPGTYANFVLWVWTTQALSPGTGVTVNLSVLKAPTFGSPAFIVCPDSTGKACALGTLPPGQADELEAVVEVPTSATAGQQWQLSAVASAAPSTAALPSPASTATDVVTATSPSPTPTPTTTPITSATSPAASGTVAPVAGTSVSPTNPSGLFPTVGASSTGTGSGNLPSPNARSALRGDTAAADVPLDARLLGGQIAGLAVLAGAIAIAITRLSLRRQKLNVSDPNAPSPPQR